MNIEKVNNYNRSAVYTLVILASLFSIYKGVDYVHQAVDKAATENNSNSDEIQIDITKNILNIDAYNEILLNPDIIYIGKVSFLDNIDIRYRLMPREDSSIVISILDIKGVENEDEEYLKQQEIVVFKENFPLNMIETFKERVALVGNGENLFESRPQ